MRLALAGLGFMGLTHLRALKSIPGAELVAVSSNDPAALSGDLTAVGGNLGVGGERFDFSSLNRYPDWAEAVRDPKADAVDLCLPTHMHAQAAIAALEAGKHVLVEKPLALNAEEAGAILDAARRADRLLMAAHVLRFFPEYTPLIELRRSGRLGPLRNAVFRRRCAAPTWGDWLPNPSKSGGGAFDLLIHDVDMALHLFGPPAAVSATGHQDVRRGIDVLTGQLHYNDGGAVLIAGGWRHPKTYPFSMEYTVTFDGGTVEYSSAGRPPRLHRQDGEEEDLTAPEVDGYQAEIEYFVDCVEEGKKPERCAPEESAAAVKLTRMLAGARARNGEKIACKL